NLSETFAAATIQKSPVLLTQPGPGAPTLGAGWAPGDPHRQRLSVGAQSRLSTADRHLSTKLVQHVFGAQFDTVKLSGPGSLASEGWKEGTKRDQPKLVVACNPPGKTSRTRADEVGAAVV